MRMVAAPARSEGQIRARLSRWELAQWRGVGRLGLMSLMGVMGLMIGQSAVAKGTDSIVAPADWGSQPPPEQAYKSRPQLQIVGVTVHHQGEVWPADQDVAAYLRRLQAWSRQARNWIDVPYHYIVAPDGRIYLGRPIHWAGDSNTDYDTMGQLQVMLLGNFEVQQPTDEQLRSLVDLLGRLLTEHALPQDRIAVHRHHTAQTVCPGRFLMTRLDDVLRQVQTLRRAAP